jgi:hypothetical protein
MVQVLTFLWLWPILAMSFGTDPVSLFTVIPSGDDFVREDALFYTDLEVAYDSALDWSVELHGRVVYIYERYGKDDTIIKKVFA